MRCGRIIVVLVIAVAAASAPVASSTAAPMRVGRGGRATVAPPRATSPQAVANRRAARRDASSLVATLKLPPAARSVPARPAHDHGYLKPMPRLQSAFASATAHAWWTVPGDPSAVLDAIESDPPAGATPAGSGSGVRGRTGASEIDVEYQWPPIAGVLGDRQLEVTVTSLGAGLTGVLAQSQSNWIVPRPASERIPATTRLIRITSAVPGAAHGGEVTVSRRGQVGSIVALLDQLAIEQPGVTACPSLSDPKTITLSFRARASGPALAVLSYVDYRPWRAAYTNQCEPVQLSIGGHRQPALAGGDFIHRIERIIGLRLA